MLQHYLVLSCLAIHSISFIDRIDQIEYLVGLFDLHCSGKSFAILDRVLRERPRRRTYLKFKVFLAVGILYFEIYELIEPPEVLGELFQLVLVRLLGLLRFVMKCIEAKYNLLQHPLSLSSLIHHLFRLCRKLAQALLALLIKTI